MENEFTDYLFKLQTNESLMENTLIGKLKTFESAELHVIMTDQLELKNMSDTLFDKFDDDGNQDLSMDEFVELSLYVDPKLDKKTCIEK